MGVFSVAQKDVVTLVYLPKGHRTRLVEVIFPRIASPLDFLILIVQCRKVFEIDDRLHPEAICNH